VAFLLPSYTVTVGNEQILFNNAYVNLSTVSSLGSGNLLVNMAVWDSHASAQANSGISAIGSVQFPVTVTPTLANAVAASLSGSPAAMAFFANATIAP
jgi:hypothetical protein